MVNSRELEKWFELNVDIDTRTIYLGSAGYDLDGGETGVDHMMAEYLIKGMHTLESKNKKPILIMMNNSGGDWYHGMAIYDAIHCSPCVCTIKVYGYAMSMGSIILQAADERIMMPNSRFMIHYGTDGVSAHTKIVERWADESKRLSWEMENIYINVLLEKEDKMGDGYLAKVIPKILEDQRKFELSSKTKRKKLSFSKDRETKADELRDIVKEMLNYDTILKPHDTVALGFADSVYSSE